MPIFYKKNCCFIVFLCIITIFFEAIQKKCARVERRLQNVEKKAVRASVEGKCPMVYLKDKKEKGFLICMNMAIYGTRTIQKNEKLLKWQPFEKKFEFRPKIARNYLNKKRTVTDTAIIVVP